MVEQLRADYGDRITVVARYFPIPSLVCGIVGTAASLALVLDRIALLENPLHIPSRDVDAVLSCGSIMASAQSEVLGFPNPLIGLAAFPVVATVGAAAVGNTPVSRSRFWPYWTNGVTS